MKFLPVVLLTALGCPSFSRAKLPEPDAVFWGTVKHLTSSDLNPVQSNEISVVARIVIGGVIGDLVGQTVLAPGQNSYLLRIPMDDGREPRLTGAVRGGEKIRLFVRNIRKSPVLEFESDQTEASIITVAGQRGTVTATNLSVNEDLEPGAPLMARFVQWRAGFGGAPPANPAGIDTDGDGASDLTEYLADTDPTSATSKFQAIEIRHGNTVDSIRFGPVRLARRYTIFSSPNLDRPDWQPVGTLRITTPAPDAWFDHVIPGGTGAKLFYRVAVDVE